MKNAAQTAFVLLLAAHAAGCGDYPSGATTEEQATGMANMEGQEVYIQRSSTRCGVAPSDALVAEVGAWVEFPSADMGVLKAPCGVAASPGVAVSIVGQGVVFDFSEVLDEGVFSSEGFDGYEIGFVRRCGDPVVAAASIDLERSSQSATGVAVDHHYDRLRINLQGLRYDYSTYLRIDLDIVPVECMTTL